MDLFKDMNKDNTILLVIDPVNSYIHEKCEIPSWEIHYSKIRSMLPKLATFIRNYKKQVKGLVVFFTVTPWDKDHLPDNLNKLYEDPSAYYYSDDKTGFSEKFHTVKPEKNDLVFIKNTYDAFSNKDFLQVLKHKKIKYILVTGVFTDGCVLASVVSGFSKGFNFIILKDLVETTDTKKRQQLQSLLLDFTFPKMYGRTISSSQLLTNFS